MGDGLGGPGGGRRRRWFAEYQPFTPMMDLFRGLLTDAPIGNSAVLTVAWSVGIALLSHLWRAATTSGSATADGDVRGSVACRPALAPTLRVPAPATWERA